MRYLVPLALLGHLLGVTTFADESSASRPWESSALNLESGLLWQIGSATPFDYIMVPTQLSWRSPEFMGRVFADGSQLVVRHRVTLFGTVIRNGPESRYVAIAGSPSIEWWDKTGRWSWYTGVGGGFGLIDSRDTAGGQGQDFTLTYLIRGGFEYIAAKNLRWSAGFLFQHLSNGGMTDPNPGIDALGFTLGFSWAF